MALSPYVRMLIFFFLMYLECWKSFEASRECKSVSRACQACLKDVSWMFQGCFRHGINTHQATRIWFKHYLSKLGWWVSAIADLADAGGVGAQNYGTVAYVILKCSLITTIPKISFFDQFRDFFHTHLYWNQFSTRRDSLGQLLKFLAGLCTDKGFLGKFSWYFFYKLMKVILKQ